MLVLRSILCATVLTALMLGLTSAPSYALNIGDSVIVEVRDAAGNLTPDWAATVGTWANSSGKSTAAGLSGTGSLYGSTYRSIVGLKEGTLTVPTPEWGTYEVFVTWGANANRRSPILHRVDHANGTASVNVDQSAAANTWVPLGTYEFLAGTDKAVITISNANIDLSGSMYADAAKLTLTTIIPEPSSLLALGTGLTAMAGFVMRRRRV